MSTLQSLVSFCWLSAITFALLLSLGDFRSAYGQPDVSFRIPDARPKLPNPPPDRNHATTSRGLESSKLPSSKAASSAAEKEKQSMIKEAITAGNKARDESQYELALASYEKVKELDPKDERAFYGLGNVYSDLACSDNAIRAYADAIRLKKDFRDALIGLGNAYANKERFDEAEAQFRALLNTNPNDVAGSIGFASISGKKKQYQEAITKLNIITSNLSIDDKDRANAHLVLGNLYMEQNKYPEAAVEFKKVIELKQFLAGAYIRLGQTELLPAMSRFSALVNEEVRIEDREKLIKAAKFAAENIRKAIYEHDYIHPYGYLLLAQALMNQFSYQEAENNLQTYLGKVRDLENRSSFLAANCDYGFKKLYSFGYLWLALSYHQQSQREIDTQKKAEYQDRVIEHAKQLIQLNESDPSAYGLLGQVYLSKGKYPEAIEQFGKAITYETSVVTKASMYELIGSCYSIMERDKDAIAAYNAALTLRPDTASARWGLAQVYQSRGEFDEAIRLKKEAMGQEPNASSHWMLAVTYFKKALQNNSESDFEEAIKLLNKAIEMNQGFGPAYFLLGQVYKFYKGGAHADEAIANYELAAKYNPKDASIYLQIGDLYYSVKKNNDAAIKYLRDAIRLDPNLARAHWELGSVYRDTGNDAEAIKYLLEAIRSDDKYQDAYFGLISIYKSQKNYAEAIKLLKRVFEFAPKEFWAHKELAKIHEIQQKNDEAIKYYQQAMALLKPEDTFGKGLYSCRIERLRRNYPQAIRCFQELKPSSTEDPGQQAYDIGFVHVASGNKKAALVQYEQLKQVKSSMAGELMSHINEMK